MIWERSVLPHSCVLEQLCLTGWFVQLWMCIAWCHTVAAILPKLTALNRLWCLRDLILILQCCLRNAWLWGHTCSYLRRLRAFILVWTTLVTPYSRSNLFWLLVCYSCLCSILALLSRIEHVLRCGSWLLITCRASCWIDHLMQCVSVRLCKVFVVGHGLLASLVHRKRVSASWARCVLSTLLRELTVFEGWSQRGAILSNVMQGPCRLILAPAMIIEKTSARLWWQGSSQVFLTAGRARRCVTSGATALGRVRGRDWRDNEKRRWRLLQLIVRLIYTADERVDQLVSRAQGEPLNEQLVYLVLCYLEALVASKLARTQLVYHFLCTVIVVLILKSYFREAQTCLYSCFLSLRVLQESTTKMMIDFFCMLEPLQIN